MAVSFSRNRADAIVKTAIFCVLTVVIVYFDAKHQAEQSSRVFMKTRR
jgi:hypothetical protein